MVRLYRNNTRWHRNPVLALLGYLRDLFVQILPFKLPRKFIKFLYGIDPDFVFLVHPRQSEDIYRALPFLTILRRFVRKTGTLRIFKHCLPCVIGAINTPSGVNGLVVSSFFLPEVLMGKNKETLREARRCVDLSSKVLRGGAFVGLGAWWPIVTRRGIAIQKFAEKKNVIVTNGHTGTLISLVLTMRKIAALAGADVSALKVAIIGAGRMGENLGRAIAGEVSEIGVIDINPVRVKRVAESLKSANKGLKVTGIHRTEKTDLKKILDSFDLAVCVTSNASRILRKEDLPDNFIIIDDSRPEAISREDLSEDKIALEGGLIRIRGLSSTYNYGFGTRENVFGCLAETYALSADGGKGLFKTLGEVDHDNYLRMLSFFVENGLDAGDLMSGEKVVEDAEVSAIFSARLNKTACKDEEFV